MNVRLRKTASGPLDVLIPAGTYFTCDEPAVQNMVSTVDVTVSMGQGFLEKPAVIPVACANHSLKIPGKHDSFVITRPANMEELEKLTAILNRKNISYHTKQAAVWIVTDDASYDDLDSLRTLSQYEPIIPGVARGRRAINEPEAAGAMRLCDEAGIDIKKKHIWSDCVKILAGLDAGELKNWLKNFFGLVAPAHK